MGVMLLELELREIWGEEPARQRVSPVRCLSGLMTGGVWSHFELPSLPITFPRDKYEDLIDLPPSRHSPRLWPPGLLLLLPMSRLPASTAWREMDLKGVVEVAEYIWCQDLQCGRQKLLW